MCTYLHGELPECLTVHLPVWCFLPLCCSLLIATNLFTGTHASAQRCAACLGTAHCAFGSWALCEIYQMVETNPVPSEHSLQIIISPLFIAIKSTAIFSAEVKRDKHKELWNNSFITNRKDLCSTKFKSMELLSSSWLTLASENQKYMDEEKGYFCWRLPLSSNYTLIRNFKRKSRGNSIQRPFTVNYTRPCLIHFAERVLSDCWWSEITSAACHYSHSSRSVTYADT